MKPVIFIVGPTASGKSAAGVELALLLGGEIVSADAISVYERLEIGAAKPTIEERRGVVHHLLGEIPLGAPFSVSQYRDLALKRIASVRQRGKMPLVVGGTGLYVHALLHDMDFANAPADEKFREGALKRNESNPGCLYAELKELDAQAAERIHPNDIKRVVRALEAARGGAGRRPYDFNKCAVLPFEAAVFGLSLPREALYARVNERVDRMMEAGLLDEVKELDDEGCEHSLPALQGLGYRQLLSHLRGECTLDEAVELIKRDTRRFAKRQITWFKRENVRWFDALGKSAGEIAREMLESLKSLELL